MPSDPASILNRTAVFCSSVAVHQITNPADIDINGTGTNAASTANALNSHIIFIYIIFQFVHEALSYPVQFGAPGVMSAAMQGKQWEHTTVPIAHAYARLAVIFILDIEAPAGGAHKRAGTAVDAGKRDVFPEFGLVQIDRIDIL